MPKAPPNPDGFDCIVVGAGLSGLVCVKALLDSPSAARIRSLHVIEASEDVGGELSRERVRYVRSYPNY